VTAAFVYHACRAGMPSLPSSTMHRSLGETGEMNEIDIRLRVCPPDFAGHSHDCIDTNDQWV
jgi:hypothetical protein